MQLNLEGLRDRKAWEKAGIELPEYDFRAAAGKAAAAPEWVHFGIGNIFRIFIGGIADRLLRAGEMDRGITCMEVYDPEVVERVYRPHDNLVLAVTLHADGTADRRVMAPFAEALLPVHEKADRVRAEAVFSDPSLRMVSFTITEKGYALRDSAGAYFPQVREDMENGPTCAAGAMGTVCALLYARYRAGGSPIALVSMDNVSRNGEKLETAVLETARFWAEKGMVPAGFVAYLEDRSRVSFPWTMIDKITPSPSEGVAEDLARRGIVGMEPFETEKHTRIAAFANAEGPEYLVIEDDFPNGRPPLEKAGVYMTDRRTVNLAERVKVTACLNPIHTALAPYDRLLGYELFADGMSDPELSRLAYRVGMDEGLPVVESPGIFSPEAFLREVLTERFPNAWLGDTSRRICVDISQGVAFRFGETIQAYVRLHRVSHLKGISLAIAGWLRYLLGVDDRGEAFDLSADPMIPELLECLSGIRWNDPDSFGRQLVPILSNASLFGLDLYEAGIGSRIEDCFREELRGPGSVRETLKRHLDAED